MTITEWFLTVSGIVMASVVAYIGKVVTSLPRDYVPRPQIDARFKDLENRIHEDIRAQESRVEKRFDAIDSKLDKIMDKLDDKADKP